MEISIQDLLNIMIKKLWLIVLFVVLGGTLAYFYTTEFVVPKYSASESYLVIYTTASDNESASTTTTVSNSRATIENCIEILDTNNFYNEIIKELEYNDVIMSTGEIADSVTFKKSPSVDASVLDVFITHSSPEKAHFIAVVVDNIFVDYLSKTYPQPGGNKLGMSQISSPVVPTTPISPNLSMNIVVGILAGGVIAVLLILMLHITDKRINGGDDIETRFNLPILGEIPESDYLSDRGGK